MRKIVFFIGMLILITGCSGLESIHVGEVKEVKFRGFIDNSVKIDVYLPVSNPGNAPLKISEMNFTAFYKNKPLGYVTSESKIKIPARSEAVYVIPLNIRVTNIFTGISMVRNWTDQNIKYLDFEGHIIAWSFLIRKKIMVDKNSLNIYFQ